MSSIGPPEGPAQPSGTEPTPPPSGEPSALSDDLLERHRAKILRPHEAVPAARGEQVQSTAYRHEYLLLPRQLLENRSFMAFLTTTLAEINLRPVVESGDLPQYVTPPVRLMHGDEPPDAPVDAWRALQRLRFRARRTEFEEVVDDISLEHLFRGLRTVTGAGGVFNGTPGTEGHHGGDSPYLNPDFSGRMSVGVVSPAPQRPAVNTRRVVVAVIDTGIGQHPWLTTSGAADPFADTASYPRPISTSQPPDPAAALDPEATGRLMEPLVGDLDSHAGHGTFIAGIVRQVAPAAKVLSIPIMYSDGIMREGDLRKVLEMLEQRVADAVNNNKPENFVDVICLAFGAYHEFQQIPAGHSVPALLAKLRGHGITIVASAGNDATSREMYPAALAGVEAVGALNPNGSRAVFSNEAGWVDWWALGSAVMSTLPTTFHGSQTPHLDNRDSPLHPLLDGVGRQSLDPDDFCRGFGLWSGTSFAAATFAAKLAAEIHRAGTGANPAHPLQKIGTADTGARRGAALQALQQQATNLSRCVRLVRKNP